MVAELSEVTTDVTEDGGGGGGGQTDVIAILSCFSTPAAADAEYFENVADAVTKHGAGPGLDYFAHHKDVTGLGAIVCGMSIVTAVALGPVDVTTITGSSAVTFSGTPSGDEEDIRFDVVDGGTIGVAGITFRVSRHGINGDNDPKIALGTATSYLIPGTGITINFGSGTLAAGDYARAYASPAKSNLAGIEAALDSVAALGIRPRVVLFEHEVASSSDADDIIAAIAYLKTTHKIHARAVAPVRDRYRDVARQGAATVAFDSATKKMTRNVGSWVTDGFKVGMTVTVDGTVSNDGTYTASVVTALEMTVVEALVNEAAVASTTITGTESVSTWKTALNTITSGKDSHRTLLAGGRARRRSPLTGARKRRNASWAILNRYFRHDMQVSPARKSDGPLEGWTIFDDNGQIAEHDERTSGGLLAKRIACLRSYVNNGKATFAEKPVTLGTEGKPMSRLPPGAVADLACTIVHSVTEDALNSNPQTNSNGTIREDEAKKIERRVTSRVKAELFASDLREGPRASGFTFALGRSTNILRAGAETTTTSVLTPLGTMEKIRNTVVVTTGES